LEQIENIKLKVEESIENFRFREALTEAMNLARLGNKYLTETEPWKLIKSDPERVKTIIYLSLQISAGLAFLLDPFLPKTCAKLREMLKLTLVEWDKIGDNAILPPGIKINEPILLFEKIEDEAILKQQQRLEQIKMKQNTAKNPVKELMPPIHYETFSTIDLRIGTIISAEQVAKAKKLLKLFIDTGVDQRTVVSGIAEYYKPEEIVGKQVIVVANLEPKELRGIVSHGMILMAETPEGKLVFVEPQIIIPNGSTVK